jgi:hypothetical protein
MEPDWKVVFTTESPFEAEVIRGMLKEHHIESVIINQRDSSYGVFGDVSLYVHKDQVEEATRLLQDSPRE